MWWYVNVEFLTCFCCPQVAKEVSYCWFKVWHNHTCDHQLFASTIFMMTPYQIFWHQEHSPNKTWWDMFICSGLNNKFVNFLLLLNKQTAKETHLSSSTVTADQCVILWTSALHIDPQSSRSTVSWVLRQQLQTQQGEREKSGSSHLFSETHKDFGNTRGNCSEQSDADTQTAAAALFIAAGEENMADSICFNHSQMSEQIFKISFI